MKARRRDGRGGLAAGNLVRLQRTAGNRAVGRLIGREPRKAMDATSAGPARHSVVDVLPIGEAGPRLIALRRHVNRVLDRVPGPVVTLGVGRFTLRQPAFRVGVWAGAVAALAVGLSLARAEEIGLAEFALVAAGGVGLLLAVLLLHRLISYAMQATVFAGGLFASLVAGLDPLRTLDIVAVALAVAQVLGRLGCAQVGCCHGRPSRWGCRYGPDHVHFGFPVRLVGVRLLPVQLMEAAWCVLLAGVGALLVVDGAPPGAALATYAVGYAAARFVFEHLRGDAERPWFGGLSQAQWTAAAIAAVVLALMGVGWLSWLPVHATLAALLLGTAARGLARWRRGLPWIERLDHVRGWDDLALALYRMEARAGVASAERRPAMITTALGLRVSRERRATSEGPQVTYGAAHDGWDMDPGESVRVADWILRLRHPDRSGVLLRRPPGPDVLVVSQPEPSGTGAGPDGFSDVDGSEEGMP